MAMDTTPLGNNLEVEGCPYGLKTPSLGYRFPCGKTVNEYTLKLIN